MNPRAINIKTIQVSADQSYTWGVVETPAAKLKRYADIDYHWRGDIWSHVIQEMKRMEIRSLAFHYLKGAEIDFVNKILFLRGNFVGDVVSDKYRHFWRNFFKCTEKEEPKFKISGKIVKLPSIAGDNDSLNLFVNGESINTILSDPEELAA